MSTHPKLSIKRQKEWEKLSKVLQDGATNAFKVLPSHIKVELVTKTFKKRKDK
jgi:hypothetical protein